MRCPTLDELPAPPADRTGWPWTMGSEALPALLPDGSPWPRVSVVTPSYNQAQYIEETIRSVLLQGYPDLEYVITDGGSTDGSVDIIRKYEKWLAWWVSEPDAGQSAAINKGWRRSTGDVLAWMNADDLYLPGAVGKGATLLMETAEAGVGYGDCCWIDSAGQVIYRPSIPDFDYVVFVAGCDDFVPSGSTFIRREVLGTIGFLDESLHLAMDWDCWVRAGAITAFVHLPEALSLFRVHPEAKTWSPELQPRRSEELIHIYRRLFSRPDLPAAVRRKRGTALSRAYLWAARSVWGIRNRREFWRYLWRGLRYDPLSWRVEYVGAVMDAVLGERVTRWVQAKWHAWGHRSRRPCCRRRRRRRGGLRGMEQGT